MMTETEGSIYPEKLELKTQKIASEKLKKKKKKDVS